jgi:Holliday junction resolvasome RuvABC DNA-binding subunit
VHSGRLIIDGDARSGWQIRHADGTSYGRRASGHRTEACAKVFEALRRLGFKESECRKALDQVRRDQQAHVGGADGDFTVEQWLRAALGVLTPAPRRRM